jgi:GTP-binding protein YchF
MVTVIDERITKLSEIYKPKKTIYAHIDYIDFAGFSSDKNSSDSIPANILALAKTTDALVLVVQNFSGEFKTDPTVLEDIETIESELIMSDLIIAENRMEKIILSKKRGIKDASLLLEESAINKIIEHLNEENSLRTLELTSEEEKAIRGFQFLSRKPLLIVINSEEDNYGQNDDLISNLSEQYKVVEFAGNFEMELSRLEEDEANDFLRDMGIEESARNRLTKLSYELLGYISFFTVGEDEVRAWTLENGSNAVEAAGKIHSDLARGFIRAECFSYENIIAEGSEKKLREKGLYRLEGKNYIVKDGDILSIRFSV